MPSQSVRSQIQKWFDQEVSDTNFFDLLIQSLDQIRLELEEGKKPDTVDLSDHDDLHALFWRTLGITFEFLGFKVVESDTDSIYFSGIPDELSDLNFDSSTFINAKLVSYSLEELQAFANLIFLTVETIEYKVLDEVNLFLSQIRNDLGKEISSGDVHFLTAGHTKYSAEAFIAICKYLGFVNIQIVNFEETQNGLQYKIKFGVVPVEISNPIILDVWKFIHQKLELPIEDETKEAVKK